jgi:hypothetical protein
MQKHAVAKIEKRIERLLTDYLTKLAARNYKSEGDSAKRRRNSPLLQAINYARLLKIVGRHLKLYAITDRKTNESLPHFPT